MILLAGPTAVGKTAMAIQLARHFSTEIISADSRQCYRELKIGVARPTADELSAAPHHFVASHSIHHSFTAADFEQEALSCAVRLFETHQAIVLTGGTGLYIKAFCEGLDTIPPISKDVRDDIHHKYLAEGIAWLQNELQRCDPLFAQRGEMQNPHRMLRALEVMRETGLSILSFQQQQPKSRPFEVIRLGLDLPREELYARINQRVLTMVEEGLEEEARSLYPWRQLPALQTVGYQEWFDYFDNRITRPRTIELIQQHTRNYAKRQLTWFRRDARMEWFSPQEPGRLFDYVQRQLNQ